MHPSDVANMPRILSCLEITYRRHLQDVLFLGYQKVCVWFELVIIEITLPVLEYFSLYIYIFKP